MVNWITPNPCRRVQPPTAVILKQVYWFIGLLVKWLIKLYNFLHNRSYKKLYNGLPHKYVLRSSG